MKNRTKFVGIIALVALIGFFFVACEGDRGPQGRLATVTLGVAQDGAPVTATVAATVANVLGTMWDYEIPSHPAVTNFPDAEGGWVNPEVDPDVVVARVPGTRNFEKRFTVTNPSAYEIPVRIDIVNHHDFEIVADEPFQRYLGDRDPALPPDLDYDWIGEDIDQTGTFWVPARENGVDGYRHFWIITNQAFPDAVGGTPGPTAGAAHSFPSLGHTVPSGGNLVRSTLVTLEVDRVFAPWVRFSDGRAVYSFTLAVTPTAP